MNENWLTIPGFPDYEVSDQGRVRLAVERNNRPAGHIMRPVTAAGGYQRVGLSRPEGRKTCLVHRLVCLAFIGEPPHAHSEAAHQDGNPANNTLTNLRWETRKENQADRVRHGTDNRGSKHPMVKLTPDDVTAIRAEPRTSGSGRALARRFNVTPAAITAIRNNRLWRSA